MDVLAVSEAAAAAIAFVREGRPYLLESRTYRFRAHSMFDAELYRSKDEVAEWKKRDPIATFSQTCRNSGLLSTAELSELERTADRQIDEAVSFAEAGTWEPIADLTRFVYSERRSG